MEHLKRIILKKLGRTLESPSDFEYLSEQIFKETGESVSPTTLKRTFGYIPSDGALRPATVSILARYAGFAGWQDYQNKQHIESGFSSERTILTSELQVGQKIIIGWNPDRECLIEYLGEERFVALHTENCKLGIGDQFSATQFILGHPFTAHNVKRLREPQTKQTTYIAGSKTGLTKLEILNV